MGITYQPNYRVHGASTWIPFGIGIIATSVSINGLSSATQYDFDVVASNTFGSATSAIVVASTTTASGQAPPGSVAGSQTSGSVDPVINGPATGTALTNGTLPVAGLTVTDVISSSVTTWNVNDKSAGYSLSNGSLTATSGAADVTGGAGIRATTSRASGKVYFEVKIGGTLTGNLAIGVANATFVLNSGNELGGDLNGAGFYPIAGTTSPHQAVYLNNVILTQGTTADVSGDTASLAYDIGADLFWVTSPAMRAASGASAWNNSGTANPGTATGGISLSAMGAGPYFITTTTPDSGAQTILTPGPPFTIATPAGFSAWDGPSTLTVTVGTGTVAMTVGSALPGSGTASITYVNTLANIQIALASLVFTAGAVVTSTNLRVAVFDRANATNSITVPIAIVARVAPSAPTAPAVSLAASNALTLTWTASTTGSPPISYMAQYKLSGAPSFTTFPPAVSGPPVTITGLAASTGYDLNVVASNTTGSAASVIITATTAASGTTAPSAPSNLIITQLPPIGTSPPAAPGPVVGLTETTATSTSIQMSWSVPSTGSGPFTYNFAFKLHTAGGFGAPVTGIVAQTFTQTGLTAATAYDFQVSAVDSFAQIGTAAVSGPWSTAAAATVPGPVVGLAVTPGSASPFSTDFSSAFGSNPITSATIPIVWSAPTTGSPPFTYNVAIRLDTTPTFGAPVTGIVGTSYTAAGLAAATAYDFQVSATNSAGNGPNSTLGPLSTMP